MTKYILNSGGLRNNPEEAKKFFATIVKGLGNNPKILLCLFAIPREDWEEKYTNDLPRLREYFPQDISPEFSLAFPDGFEQQIKESDAIYFYGGDDHLLQYWLKQFDIPNIWTGKVIGTNSASSDAMAKYFWTCDWRKCMKGLGILPIKFLPHFKSSYGNTDPRGPIDWDKAYKELEHYEDKTLPIHALEEGNYVIFTV